MIAINYVATSPATGGTARKLPYAVAEILGRTSVSVPFAISTHDCGRGSAPLPRLMSTSAI